MKMIFLTGILLVACSPYRNNEFTSCGGYKTEQFSDIRTGFSFSFPAGWEREADILSSDTLMVTATDSAYIHGSGPFRSIEFIRFPSRGYTDNRYILQNVLRENESFLQVERGLIRLEGRALDYFIGNEELYSVIVIPFQTGDQLVTIISRIDRRNQPQLNDFCYLGPVLTNYVRGLTSPQV